MTGFPTSIPLTRFGLVCLCAALAAPVSTLAEGEVTTQPAAVEQLREEAKKLGPLVKTDAVKAFLDATAGLPSISTRVVYRDKPNNLAYTAEEAEALPAEKRDKLQKAEYGEDFYYFTGYGSPLVYARPLDLVAAAAGIESFAGKRVFDFGYGSVGQLRLLASLGADAVGTEVQPVFRALYSEPGDQGVIKGRSGTDGKVTLVEGKWPAEDRVRTAVGGGFDVFTSKNTLKRGYIHPEREADPRMLIDLGVDDESYVRAMFDALKPGGYAIIYNLCPAPAPPDKPYIPWADGRCPFDRGLLEQVGFEVLEYNKDDCPAAFDFWFALGYEQGQSREELGRNLFAHYTLLRRPPK